MAHPTEQDRARRVLIGALVDDGARAAADSPSYLREILRKGAQGFANMTNPELLDAIESAELHDEPGVRLALHILSQPVEP